MRGWPQAVAGLFIRLNTILYSAHSLCAELEIATKSMKSGSDVLATANGAADEKYAKMLLNENKIFQYSSIGIEDLVVAYGNPLYG